MEFTSHQVFKGLAGFHIVRDDAEGAHLLPKREKDVPLMNCDRSFGKDGSLI
jgi:spore coat protein A